MWHCSGPTIYGVRISRQHRTSKGGPTWCCCQVSLLYGVFRKTSRTQVQHVSLTSPAGKTSLQSVVVTCHVGVAAVRSSRPLRAVICCRLFCASNANSKLSPPNVNAVVGVGVPNVAAPVPAAAASSTVATADSTAIATSRRPAHAREQRVAGARPNRTMVKMTSRARITAAVLSWESGVGNSKSFFL